MVILMVHPVWWQLCGYVRYLLVVLAALAIS